MKSFPTLLIVCAIAVGAFSLAGCEHMNDRSNQSSGFAGGNGVFGESTASPGYDQSDHSPSSAPVAASASATR